MSNPVIRVHNLGKRYRIGGPVGRYGDKTLRETVMDIPKSLFRRFHGGHAYQNETIWALKDVSFEVEQGEVVGIIGRNGAGKTTLLKILSRITEPTEGKIELRGRVGSLLEVGTGFHPELTGRENIFLNGAILGMKRAEIKKKFDEIVAFAEIEKFIDTPVKRYSSGMYVRLAFAVAAHLEPEILLVDEVLAVGDVAFQKKCLGKMGDVAKEGRTVLFVSHNMAAIQALCKKAIWIDRGTIKSYNDVYKIVTQYVTELSNFHSVKSSDDLYQIERGPKLKPIYIKGSLNDSPLVGDHLIFPRKSCQFKFVLQIPKPMKQCTVGIHFENEIGIRIYAVNTRWVLKKIELKKGTYAVHCRIPEIPLVPGHYYLSYGFSADNRLMDWLEKITHIEISATDVYGTGELPWPGQGYFLAEGEWSIEQLKDNFDD